MKKAELIDAVASKSELTKQDSKKPLMDYLQRFLPHWQTKRKFKLLDLVHLKYVNVESVQDVIHKQVNKLLFQLQRLQPSSQVKNLKKL